MNNSLAPYDGVLLDYGSVSKTVDYTTETTVILCSVWRVVLAVDTSNIALYVDCVVVALVQQVAVKVRGQH